MKTANQLINDIFPECENINSVEILMTTFAKMHVYECVKKICEEVTHDIDIDWVDYHDFSAGHNGIKGDIDFDSIKEAYPLSNVI